MDGSDLGPSSFPKTEFSDRGSDQPRRGVPPTMDATSGGAKNPLKTAEKQRRLWNERCNSKYGRRSATFSVGGCHEMARSQFHGYNGSFLGGRDCFYRPAALGESRVAFPLTSELEKGPFHGGSLSKCSVPPSLPSKRIRETFNRRCLLLTSSRLRLAHAARCDSLPNLRRTR